MEDEKYDRAFGGLQGSGSNFICTLCHATSESARESLGSFHIERTLEETNYMASYIKANPDNLTQQALAKVAKGVKSVPLLMSEPRDRMPDATHCDINMARFFKKLIVRLIVGVKQWEETAAVKQALSDSEARFDQHIKKNIGSNPMLMMPGNYARMLFDEKHKATILSLIPSEQDKTDLSLALDKFRFMRSVYRATKPNIKDINNYKATAVTFERKISVCTLAKLHA